MEAPTENSSRGFGGVYTRQVSFNFTSCLHNWRKWFKAVVAIIYAATLMVFLPWWLTVLVQSGSTPHTLAILSAAVFVMLTVPLSLFQISGHIGNYTKPYLQKHIIRIIWMVPIYSVNSWVSLSWQKAGLYLDIVRECYEAYVIYNFMMFLLNYLFYDQEYDPVVLGEQPSVKHVFPLCFLTPCRGGMTFIDNCRHGILQYTVVRPVTTFISMLAEGFDTYCEGKLRPDCWYLWMVIANNVSQFIAMYSLVMFYRAYKHQLAPMSPIGKFLCIKSVIFFSFFQSVLITLAVYTGLIPISHFDMAGSDEDKKAVVTRLVQDYLICIEMFLAALAHHYSFSYKPYVTDQTSNYTFVQSLLAMVDVSDVTSDVQNHIRVLGNTVTTLGSRRPQASHEEAHLLTSMVAPAEDLQEAQRERDEQIRRPNVMANSNFENIVDVTNPVKPQGAANSIGEKPS